MAPFAYYEITGARIRFRISHNWHYGDSSPASNEYDFEGVLVHELGHTVRLLDLYSCSGETMCGTTSAGTASYNLRTLANDDINAANAVYLP